MHKLALVLFKETYAKTNNVETAKIAFEKANILSQELDLSAKEVAWYEAYRGCVLMTNASDEEATAYATRILELTTFI